VGERLGVIGQWLKRNWQEKLVIALFVVYYWWIFGGSLHSMPRTTVISLTTTPRYT